MNITEKFEFLKQAELLLCKNLDNYKNNHEINGQFKHGCNSDIKFSSTTVIRNMKILKSETFEPDDCDIIIQLNFTNKENKKEIDLVAYTVIGNPAYINFCGARTISLPSNTNFSNPGIGDVLVELLDTALYICLKNWFVSAVFDVLVDFLAVENSSFVKIAEDLIRKQF